MFGKSSKFSHDATQTITLLHFNRFPASCLSHSFPWFLYFNSLG